MVLFYIKIKAVIECNLCGANIDKIPIITRQSQPLPQNTESRTIRHVMVLLKNRNP